MHLIAMAGLPGTGKSTLARALAASIDAHVLDKDVVRAALFGPDRVEYSRAQDDHCVRTIYDTIEHLRERGRERFVILDGRTHSRRDQVGALVDFATSRAMPWCLIECVCAEEIALERLARGAHLARNRTPTLYRELERNADPIEIERLVVDTGAGTVEDSVERVLAHLRSLGWQVAAGDRG
jgi:adenylylsulfate kinase